MTVSRQLRLAQRRQYQRYPVIAAIEYRLPNGDAHRGKTVNLSSRGVLFEVETTLSAGKEIELSIGWPVKLDEEIALTLWALGRVVRIEGDRVAAQLLKHEFRTRGLQPARRFSAQAGGAL